MCIRDSSQLAPETMIIQYDLRALDSTQVNDSHFVLNVDVATGVNDITRGPDDKIYVNEDELVLSVINSPNLIGADADYEPNRITANFSMFAFLPHLNNVEMISPPAMGIDAISIDEPLCLPSFAELYTSLPDGDLFVNNINVNDISSFQLDTGLNLLRIVDDLCVYSDTLFYNPVSSNLLPQDTQLCLSETLMIDLTEFDSVLWSDNSIDRIRSISDGSFEVVAIDSFGCLQMDSILISQATDIGDILPTDTTICTGSDLIIDLSNFSSVLWSDGRDELIRTIADTGVFIVNVLDDMGCGTVDTIMISSSEPNDLLPPSRILDCIDGRLMTQLEISQSNATEILWSSGEVTSSITIEAPSIVTVEAIISGCMVTDTIQIVEPESECMIFTEPTTDCSIYIPNAISIQSTNGNNTFRPISNCNLVDYNLEIYDRWGGRIFQTTQSDQAWDGSTNGQSINTGIYTYIISYRLTETQQITFNTGTFTVF